MIIQNDVGPDARKHPALFLIGSWRISRWQQKHWFRVPAGSTIH